MVKQLMLIALGVAAVNVAQAEYMSEAEIIAEFGSIGASISFRNPRRDRDLRDRDCRYNPARCRDYGRPLPPPARNPSAYYTCFAEDSRGRLYRGRDYNHWTAERKALDRCYRNSYYCRVIDCRYR